MECPQYLRKVLFPIQKTLRYAGKCFSNVIFRAEIYKENGFFLHLSKCLSSSGILNPLDCPHHLRASDLSVPYREGIVLDKPVKAGRGPICNIGLYKVC